MHDTEVFRFVTHAPLVQLFLLTAYIVLELHNCILTLLLSTIYSISWLSYGARRALQFCKVN